MEYSSHHIYLLGGGVFCCFDLVLIVCVVVAKSRLMIILHIEFVVVCLFRCSTVCNTRYNHMHSDWLTDYDRSNWKIPTDWSRSRASWDRLLGYGGGCFLFAVDYCCCFCCCWLWGGGGGGGVIVDVGVIVFSACQNIITKQQQQFHYPPGQQREKNRPRNMPTSRPTYPPDQPAQAHTQPPATLQSLFNERKMITKGKTTDLRQPQPSKILHFWRQYR